MEGYLIFYIHADDAVGVKVKEPRRWDWRDMSACVCLWLTYFICNAAYSIIAPFFPEEVTTTIWVGVV